MLVNKKMVDVIEVYGGLQTVKEDIGVEIEVELDEAPARIPSFKKWKKDSDGSLRNFGLEFISRPLTFEEAKEEVPKVLRGINKLKPIKTDRTSVHFHLNMQQKRVVDLVSLVTAYYFIENYLFDIYAPERKNNLYCSRLSLNSNVLMRIASCIENNYFEVGGGSKYSALNLEALTKFGTVEFRFLGGVYDPDILLEIIDILKKLQSVTQTMNPEEVFNMGLTDEYKFLNTFCTPAFKSKIRKLRNSGHPSNYASELKQFVYCADWVEEEKEPTLIEETFIDKFGLKSSNRKIGARVRPGINAPLGRNQVQQAYADLVNNG